MRPARHYRNIDHLDPAVRIEADKYIWEHSMPLLDQLTRKVTDQLPSVISPRAHAVADYATAAGFLIFGLATWKRHKRAAVTSIGLGVAELVTAALTDYPGGIARQLSFSTHGRMDVGLAALVGTMPDYMGFKDDAEARFFRWQAVALAGITGLTDFTGTGQRKQLKRIDQAA